MSLARTAFKRGFSPVGAILIAKSGVIYPSASRREIGNILHAEYRAMTMWQAENTQPLESQYSTLYSTLEPCIMCSGMAAVLRIDRIVWLVDDIWGGASRVYNRYSDYIIKRFPAMNKVELPALHQEAQDMWIDYLCRTGHADAIQFMLGLPEDYQCK